MRGADSYQHVLLLDDEETSPHAWSRLRNDGPVGLISRNISTCVEQTSSHTTPTSTGWKHLHMRGADTLRYFPMTFPRETSPHAWSRQLQVDSIAGLVGNISTCVEQTSLLSSRHLYIEKHLHMRGADHVGSLHPKMNAETSPHAWSRLNPDARNHPANGNISTCVEQTGRLRRFEDEEEKHLHMRGADIPIHRPFKALGETSPHAWSRLHRRKPQGHEGGNISTCVEQTLDRAWKRLQGWKHLHMRGADMASSISVLFGWETSPHAWSRPYHVDLDCCRVRNISTCVEQTDA